MRSAYLSFNHTPFHLYKYIPHVPELYLPIILQISPDFFLQTQFCGIYAQNLLFSGCNSGLSSGFFFDGNGPTILCEFIRVNIHFYVDIVDFVEIWPYI